MSGKARTGSLRPRDRRVVTARPPSRASRHPGGGDRREWGAGLRGLPSRTGSQPRRRLTGCRLCGNIALAAAEALFRESSILRATSNLNPAGGGEAAQQAGARGARDPRPGRDGCGPRSQDHIAGRLGPRPASLRGGGAGSHCGPPPGAPPGSAPSGGSRTQTGCESPPSLRRRRPPRRWRLR